MQASYFQAFLLELIARGTSLQSWNHFSDLIQSGCSQLTSNLIWYLLELVSYVPLTILMLTFNRDKTGIVRRS